MNPYVYSRSKKAVAPAPTSWASLIKSVFGSSVSPLLAFAFVVLAAGSVGSMTVLAYSEMTQAVAQPLPSVAYLAKSEVLGDSTTVSIQPIIQDSQLEAGAVYGKITAKPLSYDSTLGRWDYTILYSFASSTGTGTLSIGTYSIAQNITAAGSAETGSILKPSKTYFVTLWFVDSSGNQLGSISYQLKTAKAKSSSSSSASLTTQCAMPQSAAATSTVLAMPDFCIKKDDGTSQCAPITCMPPMRRSIPDMKWSHSSSTPPSTWSTSTPPTMHPYSMMTGQTASGTPPNLPPPPRK